MDALQARFRDTASEMLQNTPTITVAMGRGPTFTIETCYVVGNSDELHCIVKPNPAIVEAVRNDAHVAFTVNQGFPMQMLQGIGRAFFLGGLDQHPQIREQTLEQSPPVQGCIRRPVTWQVDVGDVHQATGELPGADQHGAVPRRVLGQGKGVA